MPYRLESSPWKSIEVWYCVGDGPVVEKKSLLITDREVLEHLQKEFRIIECEGLVLHFADKWNRLHIILETDCEANLVLGSDVACYYDAYSTAIGIRLKNTFKESLIAVLQKNEKLPVRLHYGYNFEIKNQDSKLVPSIGGAVVQPVSSNLQPVDSDMDSGGKNDASPGDANESFDEFDQSVRNPSTNGVFSEPGG